MRFPTQLLFVAVVAVTIISVGLVFLTQLRSERQTGSVQDLDQVAEPLIAQTAPPEQQLLSDSQPIRLLFGGDLMFDRNIRVRMQEHGVAHPLAQLTALFNTYDAVIANLEGPVTTFPSRSVGSEPGSANNFFFTFQPEIVPMLRDNNVTIVNLGNNHITNFGTAGVAQTKQFLQAGGIDFFGNTGLEVQAAERILYRTFDKTTIAFVNLNQFTPGGFETALVDTKTATASADLVIVMPHWGEEYVPKPNQTIRDQAQQLLAAGADAIIGSHPHVIQSIHNYEGKQVYYSLGNFVFDQYFMPQVQKGLLVEMRIWPDHRLEYEEIPIQLEVTGQTTVVSEDR